MQNDSRRSVFITFLLALAVLFSFPAAGFGQTFRGGISGSVTDQSGAVVPKAEITAVETATNTSYKAISSSAGEFAFSNLPLGDYTVTVSAPSFATVKVNKVTVSAAVSYVLPVKLSVAGAAQTIEVTASELALNTVTDEQSTAIPEEVVQDLPNSGRDFTQMLAQNTGFAGFSTGGGALSSSVNGTRTNSVNWQIEGTDNNDLWWNIPAVNQSGVNGIAAVIMPMDAIENFSFTTTGSTELGRNSGGTANVTIKSGTNALHGSAYYFNHNEALQVTNPFEASKQETRNQHYGLSVGGPIWKNKTFFFLSGEHQWFDIGAGTHATEPSAAYQTDATNVLNAYGVPVNQVALNLLNGNGTLSALWPSSALTGSDTPNNYAATGITTGYSYNALGKIDENVTDKDHIAFTYFIGQGIQTAPSSSELTPYFQDAQTHIQNYSLVYNRVLTPSIINQLAAGVSYFQQVFVDADTDFDPIGLGLNTGATVGGAPHLVIGPSANTGALTSNGSGFDPIGVTSPDGRTDITGHLDEDLTWTKGAHQFHFGGEIRRAQVHEFYLTGSRGNLFFDSTQGPWAAQYGGTPGSACAALATQTPDSTTIAGLPTDHNAYYLADFLAGCYDPSNTNITQGDPTRVVFVNTFSFYGQDAWQVTRKLSLNLGVRYDYEGPVHTGQPNLSIFDPTLASGLAVTTQDVPNLYPKFWGAVSPRFGFAYQLGDSSKTVLRGGYGLYYDSIYMKSILESANLQTGADFGPELNPAGSEQVITASALNNAVIQNGVAFYPAYNPGQASTGITSISTFDQHFRPPYTQSYDLNVQHSFSSSVVAQVGYVGTKGTHLLGMSDINAGALNSLNTAVPYTSTTCGPQYSGATPSSPGNDLQCSRPYFGTTTNSWSQNFGSIYEARSNLGSNYSSLQASVRLQNWHHLASSFGYTWGHALDYETGALPYLPQDPLNEKAEYGNSDFDVRQTFTGYLNYQVPEAPGPSRLVKGWELTSGISFHDGTPYTVISATNPSGNGENADRAVQVASNPEAGVSHAITNGAVQWFSPTAFVDAAAGQYSPTRRGQNTNPGYGAVDLAVLKTTQIRERVSAQFRADMINIFNRTNLAPAGWPTAGEAGQVGSTIGPFLGNPGIGPGEPFNVQFSLKILF
jgi:hypothetical protein